MLFDQLKRREFITLLGSAAAAWPLAARAQQGGRGRRIAALMSMAADDPEAQPRVAAFESGLRELGWLDGRNLRIEYRWVSLLQRRRLQLPPTPRVVEVFVAQDPDRARPRRPAQINLKPSSSRTTL